MIDHHALGSGLIRLADLEALGRPAAQIRRDVSRGALVRVRPGIFVAASRWSAASDRERHVLRARALLEACARPVAAAGPSAAALWDLPRMGAWPERVTILDRWAGGGRTGPGGIRTSRGAGSARIVEIDGLAVTDLARTVLDNVRTADFPTSVALADSALSLERRDRVRLDDLLADAERDATAPRREHLSAVLAAATGRSGSYGESYARASILALGFAPPLLQHEFRDERGSMFVDFFWPEPGVAVEFDGRVKYRDDRFSRGDPADVLWREKQREDRLRRCCPRVERLIWAEVVDCDRLESLLVAAGVPRVRARTPGTVRARRRSAVSMTS